MRWLLEKWTCSSDFLQDEPNGPNEVIGEGEKLRHGQEPAVTFTRLKFVQEIAE